MSFASSAKNKALVTRRIFLSGMTPTMVNNSLTAVSAVKGLFAIKTLKHG